MIYWHGTGIYFKYFDITYSRDLMDFGPGVYLSESMEHASSIARAKSYMTGASYVFKYKVNLTELRKQLNIKEFRTATKEWVEFVMMNRHKLVKTSYDIIIGPTADAKANAILKNYYERYKACGCVVTDSDYKILKEQLKVNRYGTQICLKTQRAVDIFNNSRVEV